MIKFKVGMIVFWEGTNRQINSKCYPDKDKHVSMKLKILEVNRKSLIYEVLQSTSHIRKVGSKGFYFQPGSRNYRCLVERRKVMKSEIGIKRTEIKPGDVVEVRNGGQYLVVQDMLAVKNNAYINLHNYRYDLTDKNNSNWDIVKVYPEGTTQGIHNMFRYGSPIISKRMEAMYTRRNIVPNYDMKELIKLVGHEFNLKPGVYTISTPE